MKKLIFLLTIVGMVIMAIASTGYAIQQPTSTGSIFSVERNVVMPSNLNLNFVSSTGGDMVLPQNYAISVNTMGKAVVEQAHNDFTFAQITNNNAGRNETLKDATMQLILPINGVACVINGTKAGLNNLFSSTLSSSMYMMTAAKKTVAKGSMVILKKPIQGVVNNMMQETKNILGQNSDSLLTSTTTCGGQTSFSFLINTTVDQLG